MDQVFQLDMQKRHGDPVISTVVLDPSHGNTPNPPGGYPGCGGQRGLRWGWAVIWTSASSIRCRICW
ncbi:MAG: hypothetical protein V8T10_05980 [Merdibacter sp.]